MEAQSDHDGTLVDALSRVIDAGQRVLGDRMELALAEARDAIQDFVHGITLAGFAVLFLLLPAWLCAIACAAVWLSARWSLTASLGSIAAMQLALGVALLMWSVRRRSSTSNPLEVP